MIGIWALAAFFAAPALAQAGCLGPTADVLTQAPPSVPPEILQALSPARLDVEPNEIDGQLLVSLRSAAIQEDKVLKRAARRALKNPQAAPEEGVRAKSAPTSVRYIIDAEGKLYWVEIEGHPHAAQQLYAGKAGSTHGLVPVMETGRMRYDVESKSWKLDRDWSSGLKPEEVENALSELERKSGPPPEGETPRAAKKRELREKRNLKETVLTCADIMEGQLGGKGALMQRLGMDVLSSAIVAAVKQRWGKEDYLGIKKDSTPEKIRKDRQVLASDTAGNMLGSFVATGIDSGVKKYAVDSVPEFMIRAGARYAVGVQGQKQISDAVIGEDPKSQNSGNDKTADQLASFNTKWFVGRLIEDPLASKFITRDLPGYAFNSCKEGSLLRIVLSPGVVRIFERAGTTALYFGLRSHFVGH